MIVECVNCHRYLDDEFRTTICPHEAFSANDGHNNFTVHDDAYLSDVLPTSEKLALALEAAHATPMFVRKAREGYYDDYRSPLATPLMALVEEARRQGLMDIVERVKDGEFDGTREESTAWADSPEGRDVFRELMGSDR